MNAKPIDLRELTREEVIALVAELGEKPYRAKQVWEWLWKKHAPSVEAMSDLPKAFRAALAERAVLRPLAMAEQQHSDDGTVKCALRTWDGHVVEAVLIPTEERITACVSCQIGCSLNCAFCATGLLKRIRNLTAGEIVDQVVHIARLSVELYQRPLTNIVYMGMGEPLLNYANVMRSTERINAEDGLGMSYRRITVSTAGIAKMIRQLGDDGAKFNLALSLHAPTDAKRSSFMPINDSNSIAELMGALRHYTRLTRKDITFEYILFRDINDSLEDARDLVRLCSQVNAKVNLIEYNATGDGRFQRSPADRALAFQNFLQAKGITARIRRSRGRDIDAACGQLANKNRPAEDGGERLLKPAAAQKP
ncbi:MAG: 23S rRNA (adenine(2503)-C(2))-methyltransferase RlmN [Flavobacteriales bacterium]|nr:23S rRNA (adenine(2503)-C(2))-methyltransferase RlmN [Flavobacteriales bacterium]MCL4281878.1 23S rRNA (adenine(2503)-C(2))-methyltransferase RlmN [Flavobacteriales bacterium]